jgi:hypothetical protein
MGMQPVAIDVRSKPCRDPKPLSLDKDLSHRDYNSATLSQSEIGLDCCHVCMRIVKAP